MCVNGDSAEKAYIKHFNFIILIKIGIIKYDNSKFIIIYKLNN